MRDQAVHLRAVVDDQERPGLVVAGGRRETARLDHPAQEGIGYGVLLEEPVAPVKSTFLSGKTVVFTGELREFSRSRAEEIVRKNGGIPSSSISKKTNLLVIGQNPGSKYDKAITLGVNIIDEKRFKEMIG